MGLLCLSSYDLYSKKWRPQSKSCTATRKGTCTVTIHDVKNGKARVATCTALRGSTCTARLNAIEEVPQIDLNTLEVQALGPLTQDVTIEIDLPLKEGESTAFSFTPTAGELANKELTVVYYKEINPIGTRLYGKTLIAIYRFIEGDEPTNWQQMGEITNTGDVESFTTNTLTIQPDGTVLIVSPFNEPPVEMAIGNLNPTDD